ncbi:MAG: PfkB family carbohydrate kinase [Methylococcales bacterium]|nr:PfkB family carbohydrate kinase [Methylococcales bacterium]
MPHFDVFCIGYACYDLTFHVPHHPGSDEKVFADQFLACGGGPAANAAVTAARLGAVSGFCGYLGQDTFGELHVQELRHDQVNLDFLVRGAEATPLSSVFVKPEGQRTLVNYQGQTPKLPPYQFDFTSLSTRTLLFDGHQPRLSLRAAQALAKTTKILDAGSVHEGTLALLDQVDYLVASEKFALDYAGSPEQALTELAKQAPAVVITLGEKGVIWRRGQESGQEAAIPVCAVDSNGCGDAYHGAFAAGLAQRLPWPELLRYAGAAGSVCCTRSGARTGLPYANDIAALLSRPT